MNSRRKGAPFGMTSSADPMADAMAAGFFHLLLRDPPRFLIDAVRVQDAGMLANAIGVTSVDLFRERLVERGRRLLKYYGPFTYRISMFGSFDFSQIVGDDVA